MRIRSLRGIFDGDPELYARARPRYPDELFDDLGDLAPIGPGTRLAEIGPGTGQATAELARRGAQVVGVEPGSGLADVLRSEQRGTDVEVVVSAFEDWILPAEPFDAVAAFTAWHWLDSAVRTTKAAMAFATGRGAGHGHHHARPRRQRGVLRRGAALLPAVGSDHTTGSAALTGRHDPDGV